MKLTGIAGACPTCRKPLRAAVDTRTGKTAIVCYPCGYYQIEGEKPEEEKRVPKADARDEIRAVLIAQLPTDLPVCVKEFKFYETRRWRADLAWPALKLLVEIEGFDHRRKNRYNTDIEKYNRAALDGYTLLRYTPKWIHDGRAAEEIAAVVRARCGETT